ncbi:MAG: GntR family transcriptional regulator [Oscillibacter sp.]|jgi:DNA-binding GntR family transcriptional regulator|nr:GntR family transcriptional regulator [Oscillibacter sp.]MCI9481217.1 GntR family transcriptional regulator [Oscillibacter sp.]
MKFVKPLQIQAYERLKSMIIQGDFQPSLIYSETKVSQTLGISRTPVRDAIQRLAQEGYLDVLPSKGFCLHKMTEQDLLETYQIRCALEGFCVVQLARDFETPAARKTFTKLKALLQCQETVLNGSHFIEEFAQYDQDFHETIVYYLQNAAISETFDNFHYQMSRQITLSLGQEGRMEATLREHRAIVENMCAGAVGRSYEAALDHLEKPKGIIHLDSGV